MIGVGAFAFLLFALARPFALGYFLLFFMFASGLVPRSIMSTLQYSVGAVNVFPLDLAFACMAMLIVALPVQRVLKLASSKTLTREASVALSLVVLYLAYQAAHAVAGLAAGVPVDSLVRMFSQDAQVLYLAIPLLYARERRQFRWLLFTVIGLGVLFPFGQLTLVGSEDTDRILRGQGTFRLGFGDFNVVLAIALLAHVIWERRVWLGSFPAAGIILLAHRSAFIGIVCSYAAVSILRGRKLRSVLLLVVLGAVLVVVMSIFQALTTSALVESGLSRAAETFEGTKTTSSRLVAIQQSLTVFAEHPLFGMGYFGALELRRQEAYSPFAFNVNHPHNFLMSSLSKDGLVGTVILLLLIGQLIWSAWRLSRLQGQQETGALLFGSMLFFVLFSGMNTTLTSCGYVLWWLGGATLWLLADARRPTAAVNLSSENVCTFQQEVGRVGVRLR